MLFHNIPMFIHFLALNLYGFISVHFHFNVVAGAGVEPVCSHRAASRCGDITPSAWVAGLGGAAALGVRLADFPRRGFQAVERIFEELAVRRRP